MKRFEGWSYYELECCIKDIELKHRDKVAKLERKIEKLDLVIMLMKNIPDLDKSIKQRIEEI